MNRWKVGAIIGMIGLYCLGIVSGVALVRLRYQRRVIASFDKPPLELRTNFLLGALRLALSLSDQQVEQIKPLAAHLIRQRAPHMLILQRNTFQYRMAFFKAIKPLMKANQQKAWARLYARYSKPPLPVQPPGTQTKRQPLAPHLPKGERKPR